MASLFSFDMLGEGLANNNLTFFLPDNLQRKQNWHFRYEYFEYVV
jgi:hypothetical protein